MNHPEMVSPGDDQNSMAPSEHVGLTPRRSPPDGDDNPAAAAKEPRGKSARLAARLVRGLPNLLVLSLLGTIVVWGQRTGWKLPKFSAVVGQAEEAKDDWCAEHNVPESMCVECKPELLPRGPAHGWCEQHGVQDCPWCHPDVAQLAEPAKVDPADLTEAQRALAAAARATAIRSASCSSGGSSSPRCTAFERTGIEVEAAQRAGRSADRSRPTAEVGYDQTRLVRAFLAPSSAPRFAHSKALATRCRPAMFWRSSMPPEVGQAKAEYLNRLAEADFHRTKLDRAKAAVASGAIPDFRYQEAVRRQAGRDSSARPSKPSRISACPSLTPELAGLSADALGGA